MQVWAPALKIKIIHFIGARVVIAHNHRVAQSRNKNDAELSVFLYECARDSVGKWKNAAQHQSCSVGC